MHVIGLTCEVSGPRVRRGVQTASTPRRTALLNLSVHTGPRVRPHIRCVGGIRTPTMKQSPSMLIFDYQQAEKSPQNQHVLSFNPRYVRLVPEPGGVVGVGVLTARISVRGSGYTKAGRPVGGPLHVKRAFDQSAIEATRRASFDLRFAAWFLWMTPLETATSSLREAIRRAARALSLSPASTASRV